MAQELQTEESRYSRIIWTGENQELPGGFDRFIGAHGLNVMFANARNEAFNVAGTLKPDDVVLMFGVDVPADYWDECVFPPIWSDGPE